MRANPMSRAIECLLRLARDEGLGTMLVAIFEAILKSAATLGMARVSRLAIAQNVLRS